MIDRTYIKAERTEKSLILTLIDSKGDESCGIRAIKEHKEAYSDEWQSDKVMYEFFEGFIANTEWEWISAEDIGALTSAPILGIKDENGEVIEAYGFMDYALRSILDDLFQDHKVIFQKG